MILKFLKEICNESGLTKIIGNEKNVSFTFVSPRVISKINREYVGHKGVTDVISFSYLEENYDDEETVADIMICVEVAHKEGQKRDNSSYAEELALYAVHGILHIVGEDDLTEDKRKQMRRREREVITKLKQNFDFNNIFPT